MMNRNEIFHEYFAWLSNLVCGKRYPEQVSYNRLLIHLHHTDFRYSILKDENRAEDGVSLRYRFALEYGFYDTPDCLNGPCSVLEMMVALAVRCEEDIMDDPHVGNRTGQWFWTMITNLGLGSMTDDRFDETFVYETIERLLDRQYEPDGRGGLFRVRYCDIDLRGVEIWRQMCWYLDGIM